MVRFECDTCGVRVSREVSLLEDEGRLCDDGWSVTDQRDYLPEDSTSSVRRTTSIADVSGDHLLNGEDVLTIDRFEAAPLGEYVTFFGCCKLTGETPNTFCATGHRFATEISDHCSRVIQLHRDRVRVVR